MQIDGITNDDELVFKIEGTELRLEQNLGVWNPGPPLPPIEITGEWEGKMYGARLMSAPSIPPPILPPITNGLPDHEVTNVLKVLVSYFGGSISIDGADLARQASSGYELIVTRYRDPFRLLFRLVESVPF
jgi:hypothetical protein